MRSWSYSAGVTHGTNSSSKAGAPATSTHTASQAAAANGSQSSCLSGRSTDRLAAAACTGQSQVPAASLSVTRAMAQRAVGHSIQLADKPILGAATVQPQGRQETSACSRHAVATALAEGHRSDESALGGAVDTERAGNAVSRAASPPFFLEGDAGEDSLMDVGEIWEPCAASETTTSRCQHENTAGSLLEAKSKPQTAAAAGAALPDHQPAVNPGHSAPTIQALSLHQQPGSPCSAAVQVEAQPIALKGLHTASQWSRDLTQPVTHSSETNTIVLPQTVQRAALGKPQSQQAGALLDTAAAPTAGLGKHTAAGPQAEVVVCTGSGNSKGKENEEVGMARAVRRVRDAESRLDRQSVVQPVKPIASSKVSGCYALTCATHAHQQP